ncbi:MAG: hypothetical protein D6796_00565 [Caldilineae bacterium]|nr:MAG: hypothetical protein D6796_00565 [Caldilineae bacterium]
MQPNPFTFGDPVTGEAFLNRKRELRRLVGRVRQGGSAIITAEPRMGKTSLLLHLRASAADLFDKSDGPLLFHYLDGHTMAGWDAARFWREAFRPLAARWKSARAVYEQGAFEATAWEPVFQRLEKRGRRFVLLVDEFDALQNEPGLHGRAVYGMLRSLASRYRSFSLVIAARRSITDLNYRAREFAGGSPYFNFAQEISLEPLPDEAVKALLARAGERFVPADRAFLQRIAGRHPYFLQTAASYLWEMYEEADDAQARYRETGEELFAAAGESVLGDIWAAWTPYMQIAFTLAALDSASLLLEGRAFDIQALLRDLPDLSPELRKLARRGFLRPDERLQSGYTPHAEVMLWYLADELTRLLRGEMDLKTWLGEQQWDGLLKIGEKEALKKFLGKAVALLQKGASAFIKAAAEGAAKGMVGNP